MRPIVFFLLLQTIVFSGIAQPHVDQVRKDFPNIVNDFGDSVKAVSSYYIFVVDISDKTFCNTIKSELNQFISALSENDLVAVIQLGPTNQTIELVPPGLVKKNLSSIQNQIRGLKCGTDGSDGYRMIEKVINALSVNGTSNSVPFVFIFSDFLYFPPRNFPQTSEWDQLKTRYQTAAQRYVGGPPNINIFKFPEPSGSGKSYFDQLRNTFGSIEETGISDSSLIRTHFVNMKAKNYEQILRYYIRNKANKQKEGLRLKSDGGGIRILSNEKLVYDQIELDEHSKSRVDAITKKSGLFSFSPPLQQEVKLSGKLISSNYKNEIKDLNDLHFSDQNVTIVSGDSYIPWWLTDVLALVLLLLFLRMIWCLFPSSFNGMITFTSLSNSDAANFNYNSSGKKTFTLGYGQLVASDKNLFGSEEFSLKVTAKRHFMKGKCIELFPQKGELRGKKGSSVIRKNVKTLVKPSSKWSINGVDIRLPNVR